MNYPTDMNKVVLSLVEHLNNDRILHYFRFTTEDTVIFYISPSQHYQALKYFDLRIPSKLYQLTYGIDSDFDYWIILSKI